MSSIFQFFAFLATALGTFGFRYDLEMRSENIAERCPEYPNNFYDKFFTRPENITILPDGTFRVAGDILFIYDFKQSIKGKLHLEFYKRERGSWQKTIYTIKRDNLCESVFDAVEVWGPFFKNVPAEKRKCPLEKGRLISIDVQTDQGFNLPSAYLEGEYWCRGIFGDTENEDTFCCVDLFFHLYRS